MRRTWLLAIALVAPEAGPPADPPCCPAPTQLAMRACTGGANCSACTDCSRCAHCAAGGSCGVCRRARRPRPELLYEGTVDRPDPDRLREAIRARSSAFPDGTCNGSDLCFVCPSCDPAHCKQCRWCQDPGRSCGRCPSDKRLAALRFVGPPRPYSAVAAKGRRR